MSALTDNMHPKWIKLASLTNLRVPAADLHFLSDRMVNINPNEFIASTSGTKQLNLQKYNAESNKFTKFLQNENGEPKLYFYHQTIAFNQQEKKIYFYGSICRRIDSFNLKTNQKNTFRNMPRGKYFLSINNNLHIIADHNKQWIASIQNNELKTIINEINELDIEDDLSDETTNELESAAAIYIASKQCILLIGGYYNDEGPLPGQIWMYSLSSNKWTKINNISFPRYGFGAVLTSNQRYILLFGGRKYNKEIEEDDESDNIFVIDMKNENDWTLKQSKLLCPQEGMCDVLRTCGIDSKNEILVIGFVKDCFKTKAFEHLQLPPMYIVSLIAKWFSAEMIHWMKNDKHYGIYLNHILLSLYD